MADITITIPNAHIPRVRKALCEYAGLEETNANVKSEIVKWIKQITIQQELKARQQTKQAEIEALESTQNTADEAIIADVDSINIE